MSSILSAQSLRLPARRLIHRHQEISKLLLPVGKSLSLRIHFLRVPRRSCVPELSSKMTSGGPDGLGKTIKRDQ